ncbi:MAG: response regulator [Candidatus Rokubacteria bacterium]|nr:response regulator [Candidatus Rokubacteria bacterium]
MERTILVAEDSPTQADHLRFLLEGEGYRVDVVGNGREGLERARTAPPDLIISDVVMPEMDGYTFCEAVKSGDSTRRIPFVLLTERNTPEDFVKGLQHGADNFIAKPPGDYLLERVRRIFQHLELRRQGGLDVEITIDVGGRHMVINADRQQMVELLFSTLEELVRTNTSLREAQETIEEHAKSLEMRVQERTEQLLQSEKLATMGELLAGVAHELNNPLAVVLGRAELLRQRLKDQPLGVQVDKLAQAATRCARIVRNFLALARHRVLERQPASLNKIVHEALELLAYPLRIDDVEVTLDLAQDLPTLWADPHQLHQVAVNLVTNAHHAMRETPPPRRLSFTSRYDPEKRRVSLEVADTGPGIPAHVRARIFEPFFTTKPPGQGTGLGLSLCQGLVEGHGGSIRAESQPGQGAVFVVELPVQAPPMTAPDAGAGEATAPIGGKTILVVDDEPEVASVLADMLSGDGHQVETAENGAVALDKLRRRPYDLVLCDLRMPELDGPGLYRALQQRDPQLSRRVIFLTGDVLSSHITEFLEGTAAFSLSKPFDFDEVRQVVQAALQAT